MWNFPVFLRLWQTMHILPQNVMINWWRVTWMIQNFSCFNFDLGDTEPPSIIPPPSYLLLTENIKMDGIPTKLNEKYTPFGFLHCIQLLKVTSYKNCRIQPLNLLFLLFCISFYICRYHFSPIFRNSFNIVWKK